MITSAESISPMDRVASTGTPLAEETVPALVPTISALRRVPSEKITLMSLASPIT